jgi:hypothetical protein
MFLAVGSFVSAVAFWRLHCGDGPFYFSPVLVGCFFTIAYGAYLLTAHLSKRTQFVAQHLNQCFELAREHGLASTFRERIIRTDETRIPRRTKGRGEFRAAGAGCLSGPQSGEPEEASPQAYTPQKERAATRARTSLINT